MRPSLIAAIYMYMSSFRALLLGSKHVRHGSVGFYVIYKISGLSRTLALLRILLHKALNHVETSSIVSNYYLDPLEVILAFSLGIRISLNGKAHYKKNGFI